jgi:hypothetical protein
MLMRVADFDHFFAVGSGTSFFTFLFLFSVGATACFAIFFLFWT